MKQYHPNKVSIRDIAAEAGVSVVTIYNHFLNKDGLIFEIVKQMTEEQLETFQQVLEGSASFQEKMQVMMVRKARTISDFHPDFINYMMVQPEINEYLLDTYHRIGFPMIQQLIEQGKREGFIAADMPVSLIMSVFELYTRDLTSKNSILLNSHNLASEYEKLFEILIYGISGKK